MVGFSYLVATLVFDNEIHKFTLKVGFSMRSSRAKKFNLFFMLVALQVIIIIMYYSLSTNWTMPQNWVRNSNNFENDTCSQKFEKKANNEIGLSQTFCKSSVLCTLMGMLFGWPFAMHHFQALQLQWINTKLWKRLVRLVFGIAVAVGIDGFFLWVISNSNDLSTKYLFGYAVPNFLSSYWIFGIFPIVCKWTHLVQDEKEL